MGAGRLPLSVDISCRQRAQLTVLRCRARDEVTSEHRVNRREVDGVVQEVRGAAGGTSHLTELAQTDAEDPLTGQHWLG